MKNRANTLVVGYGNTLREDDGFGVAVVRLLDGAKRLDLIESFQLTPEMSQLFAQYKNIIFIDINVEVPAGVFAVPLTNTPDPFNHTLSPQQLIKYASDLYGFDGQYFIFSVGGKSFGYGKQLSSVVASKADELVRYLKEFSDQI